MAQIQVNTKKRASGLSKEYTHKELGRIKRACNRAIGRVKNGKELPVDVKRELSDVGLDPATITLATLKSLRQNAIDARKLVRERKTKERLERAASQEQGSAPQGQSSAPQGQSSAPQEQPKAAEVPSLIETPAEAPKAEAPKAEAPTEAPKAEAKKKTSKKKASKNPANELTRKKKVSKKAPAKKAAAKKSAVSKAAATKKKTAAKTKAA